jgi:hypothetical protein
MKESFVALSLLIVLGSAGAMDKKDLKLRWDKKYIVVLREGLAAGICGAKPNNGMTTNVDATLEVRISGDTADYKPGTTFGATLAGCRQIVPQQLHKGEVLFVRGVGFHKGVLMILAETTNAHQVDRGVGAFEHQSYERAVTELRFSGCEHDGCQEEVEKWVKVFDTQQDAVKYANTASGVYVKEIKLGMTQPEVEGVMGPPHPRIAIGELKKAY